MSLVINISDIQKDIIHKCISLDIDARDIVGSVREYRRYLKRKIFDSEKDNQFLFETYDIISCNLEELTEAERHIIIPLYMRLSNIFFTNIQYDINSYLKDIVDNSGIAYG